MFTGIVEAQGRVWAVEDQPGGRRLRFSLGANQDFLGGTAVGDSIAVDGACLTVVWLSADHFEVELVSSTLERTIAARYEAGAVVNLERAMLMGSRLDGHLVQGHVDGIGELVSVTDQGGTRLLDFSIPVEIWEQTILHGSITLNGVSLTVNTLDAPDRCG